MTLIAEPDRDETWTYRISLQQSFKDMLEVRDVNDGSLKFKIADREDLLMIDGYRVWCLIWILLFGAAQFTMGGLAYNPWNL